MINLISKKQQTFVRPLSIECSGSPGWIDSLVQPGNQPFNQNSNRKGDLVYIFGLSPSTLSPSSDKEKKEGKNEPECLMDDDNKKAAYLIRAAELALQGGNLRPSGPDPTPAEQLGIRVNILRRQLKKDLEWLGEKSGYGVAELMAFEAGLLPNKKMLEIFSRIAVALDLTVPADLVLSRRPPIKP